MIKYVLQEDDCAPDAREYFDKDLKKLTGMTIIEFQQTGIYVESDDGLHLEWIIDNWVLSYDGDDPFFKLEICT